MCADEHLPPASIVSLQRIEQGRVGDEIDAGNRNVDCSVGLRNGRDVDQFGQFFEFLLAQVAQIIGQTGLGRFGLENLAIIIRYRGEQLIGLIDVRLQ